MCNFRKVAVDNFYVDFDRHMDRVTYLAVAINEEAGEVAGEVKKCIRDDGGKFSEERTDKLLSEMGDLLYYIAMMADTFDMSIEDLMGMQKVKIEMLGKKRKGIEQD